MVKSVVKLWQVCLHEAGLQHHVRTERDSLTASARIEEEGLSFLTITLPVFEKALLRGIAQGRVSPDSISGFRFSKGLPAFMSGFLEKIFDVDGSLRPDADPGVIKSLRQVLLLCSKIELPTSEERKADAYLAYIKTDEEIEAIGNGLRTEFRSAAMALLGPYLQDVEKRLWSGDWLPQHASGALATGESYNARYTNRVWTERLQECFPWWEDLAVSPREIYDHGDDFEVLSRDQEPPVRVILVPKTMKTPRVIAEEPCWMMFVQQGIFRVMTETLLLDKHRYLNRIFGWMDQEPNRLLAREGSRQGGFATIDLSEASDRVSLQLVEDLLSSTGFLKKCVLAARSETAEMAASGRVMKLSKFASMGSALCFPIESMVFFIIEALAVSAVEAVAPSTLRVRDLPRMRVFGDDLIVPSSVAQMLMSLLESYGLKVNGTKSFTTGPFRESCGSEWFNGEDVSVFRLRAPLPTSTLQSEYLKKGIDFHNRVYDAGWFNLAGHVEDQLRSLIPNIPIVPVGTPVSALWSWNGPYAVRNHSGLQRIQYKALTYRQFRPLDTLDGYGALKKYYANRGEEPRSADHLERDGRSRYAGAHIEWTTAPW